jgi:hypothetical protein
MSVTDPDVPDPLHDPRTRQADPGAVAQGEDLASGADDDVSTGEDELVGDASGHPVDDGFGDGAEAPTADRT